jgi:GntR family transcriptional regulator
MIALEKESPIPLYHQLQELLRSQIERGDFKESCAIPTEPELEQLYGVSRVTVRRAVQELVQEGLLTKRRGKGTFIRGPKVRQNLNTITSWAETMAARGVPTENRNIEIATVPAPPKVAELLQLPLDAPAVRVRRLRCTAEGPLTLMTNYLLPELVPGLTEGDVAVSLYDALEHKFGIALLHAREQVEAKAAGVNEARLLEVRRGAPLLHITRVTYGQGDRPIEVVEASSRADRYSYEVGLFGRPKK